MAIQNISKYVQINDFLLLEYEFSRDGEQLDISNMGPVVAETTSGVKQFFNNNKGYALGSTNNILELNSIATDVDRSIWFNNYTYPNQSFQFFDSSIAVNTNEYAHDTIKLHVISGYNFDDIAGFLLQVRAEDDDDDLVDLSNFTYIKQPDALGSADVVKFSSQSLYLGNRFYDKYIEFKIPSIYDLGNESAGTPGIYDTSLGQLLGIAPLSDVFITYSTVPTVQADPTTDDNTFTLPEKVSLNLPVTSVADSFNALILESTAGDFIEFYATWNDNIIGEVMGDIESGRIPLYTSNNPNDNYEEFSNIYGSETAKWVVIHELYIYEHYGNSSILNQQFSFTQDSNFSIPNYFRPVLRNSDIDSSYTIQYVCRLSNRMDGSQIIRRASFSSVDPKKYGLKFQRINVDNILPYKVFNKLEPEQANILAGGGPIQTKFTKVFFDTTNIVYNEENVIYEQGTGQLYFKQTDSLYKFKFEKYNETASQRENVDLSGAYNYELSFVLADNSEINIVPTYSTNMNTALGELEFKLSKNQIANLLSQTNNNFSILVKNPNGTSYAFYEGVFSSLQDKNEENTSKQNYQQVIAQLNKQLVTAKASNSNLQKELDTDKANKKGNSEISTVNKNSTLTKQPVKDNTKQVSTKEKELADRINILEKENLALTITNNTLEKVQPTIKKPRKPTKPVLPAKEIIKVDYQRMRGTKVATPKINPNKKLASRL